MTSLPTGTEATASPTAPGSASPPPAPPGDGDGNLPRPSSLAEVKGWFDNLDQLLFDWLLARQHRLGTKGGLLELGAYLGKSAAFLGGYLNPGESLTVCDLFDSPAEDDRNLREMQRSYATLTRRAFEANYLAFHDTLPSIVQAPTSSLAGRLEAGSFRFVHVDASHLYEHVHGDIALARDALTADGGIVALDDYRAEHTPGVAAATWGAVLTGGLRPVCISGRKFYGTWGDPEPVRGELIAWFEAQPGAWHEVQSIAGHEVVRVSGRNLPSAPQPASRHSSPDPATGPAPAGTPAPAARRPLACRIAADWLPPAIARPLAARLRRR